MAKGGGAMYTVYCHVNKLNGKRYFGITSLSPDERWKNGNGYRSSRHFRYAIEKYGWDNFTHEIIETGLSKDEACEKEKRLIEKYNTTDERYGYNMSTGGECGAAGVKVSKETRAKKSASLKGRKFSEETRRKLSEAAKGRKFSQETIAKMSAAKKGKPLSKEHVKKIADGNRGKSMSDESRIKIRESKRGMMKPVYCFEMDTTYESISEAARQLGLERTNLKATLKGKHKHCGGYHFKYDNE